MMSDADIWDALLRRQTCACGSAKRGRQSFCPGCWGRLPEGLRTALWERAEYPSAYRRALTFLQPAPTAP